MRQDGRLPWLCFFWLHDEQEDLMSELETRIEAEVEDFSEELSDEALDRAEGGMCPPSCYCC